jgi:hypothetical protein
LELASGERALLRMPDIRAASTAALLAAGVVKATRGTLYIGDFDPRIQPVQAKRLVGFVPRAGSFGGSARLQWISTVGERSENRLAIVDFHSALHEVGRDDARRRVADVLAAVERDDESAFALALALIRPIALLVVDQPPAHLERCIADVVPACTAVLATAAAPAETSLAAPLAEAAR